MEQSFILGGFGSVGQVIASPFPLQLPTPPRETDMWFRIWQDEIETEELFRRIRGHAALLAAVRLDRKIVVLN